MISKFLVFCGIILFFVCFFKPVTIPEGYVGVFKIFGKIQDNLIIHWNLEINYFSSIELVKYVQDNDEIYNMKCVSKEGVDIIFGTIEIANEIKISHIVETTKRYGVKEYDTVLVTRPITQKMMEICANFTVDEIEITNFHMLDDMLKVSIQEQNDILDTGIKIQYVRIKNIIIPPIIKEKRLNLADEKAKLKLRKEEGLREEYEIETKLKISKKEAEIRFIKIQEEKNEEDVRNQIQINRAKMMFEKSKMESESIKLLYEIPGYVELEIAKSLNNNTKIYYGEKLPNYTLNRLV